jgi:hypothetical protein
MLFGDPYDGIGLKYKGFSDKVTPKQYESMLSCLLRQGSAVSNVIWLSVNVLWSDLLGKVTWQFRKESDWEFKPCVQIFTFGQHRETDLGNNHRLLYRYMKKGTPVYPDEIRVPSWRQINGDSRASDKGRVPGDDFRFETLTELDVINIFLASDADVSIAKLYGVKPVCVRAIRNGDFRNDLTKDLNISDTFRVPRVPGNSKQRRDFSPTQLHEDLYERCIKLCCPRGSTVVDLFAGSGTLGRVADRCGVDVLMLEKSRETVDNILKDQPDVVEVSL